MSENQNPEENLADEFQNLGQTLVNTMRAAWERPERKKLQQEIEEGLTEFASTIKDEVDTFSNSPKGQRIKSDVQDFQERIRTGETENQVREELLKALRIVNDELQKVTDKLKDRKSTQEKPENAISEED